MGRADRLLEAVNLFQADPNNWSLSYSGTSMFMTKDGDVLKLKGLVTPESNRNQGHATELLKYACKFADDNHLKVEIVACPPDPKDLTKLVEFYKRFGFVKVGSTSYGGVSMIRRSK